MKFLSVILLSSFFSFYTPLQLTAQSDNLIPDPSAENMIECPEHVGGHAEDGNGIDRYVPEWISIRDTPDYFHSCTVSPLLGWHNSFGNQEPRSGEGYLGVYTYDSPDPDYREIFGTAFTEPLVIGESYRVTFHVVMAVQEVTPPSIGYLTGLATNNIGCLLLTENSVSSLAEGPLPNRVTFKLDTVLTDTINWTEVSYEFVADSAYTHIAFGNFFDDDSTIVANPFEIQVVPSAYYFFDDFCVTQVNNDCNYILGASNLETPKVDLRLYPNPTHSGFTVKNGNNLISVALSDAKGKIIRVIKEINSNEIRFDFGLDPGLYFVQIVDEKSRMTKKLVVQP